MKEFNYIEELQKIIDEEITPCFQSNGFKKSGNSYYKENGDLIGVCSIQRSRDNSQIFARFTLNIKISMPTLFKELGMSEKKKLNCVVFDMTFSGLQHLITKGSKKTSRGALIRGYTVTFPKYPNKPQFISRSEFINSYNKSQQYSSGDPDVRLLEMAVNKIDNYYIHSRDIKIVFNLLDMNSFVIQTQAKDPHNFSQFLLNNKNGLSMVLRRTNRENTLNFKKNYSYTITNVDLQKMIFSYQDPAMTGPGKTASFIKLMADTNSEAIEVVISP